MHSIAFPISGTEEVTFFFNSDLSGDVQIAKYTFDGVHSGDEVGIPGQVLLDFVASWVRDQKIAALEEQSTNEVLGLESNGA